MRRWVVAGPGVSLLAAWYDAASEAKDAIQKLDNRHHEHTERSQRAILDKVDNLIKVVTDTGNPFREDTADLLSLYTKDIAFKCCSTDRHSL